MLAKKKRQPLVKAHNVLTAKGNRYALNFPSVVTCCLQRCCLGITWPIKQCWNFFQCFAFSFPHANHDKDAIGDVEQSKDEEHSTLAPCEECLGDHADNQVEEESTEGGNRQSSFTFLHLEELCWVKPRNDAPSSLEPKGEDEHHDGCDVARAISKMGECSNQKRGSHKEGGAKQLELAATIW